MSAILQPAAVAAARSRIAGRVRHTPAIDYAGPSGADAAVSLKLEFLQYAGSFKTRGAFNTLLSQAIPAAGIAAASGGNHGASVAFAAARLGIPARIFVPETSSPVKIARIRGYGADVVVSGARYADAAALCETFIEESGALGVHPYDSIETIAGQGTAALEWQEDRAMAGARPLDTVIVAIGGGGLWAGTRLGLDAHTQVIGVEPVGSQCFYAALRAGYPVDVDVQSIAGDSLGAKRAGRLAFELADASGAKVVLVEDAAIRQAQKRLWNDLRIAVEPGGAAAFAAYASGAYEPAAGELVGIMLCGANVDLAELAGFA